MVASCRKSFFAANNGTGTPTTTYAFDGEGKSNKRNLLLTAERVNPER